MKYSTKTFLSVLILIFSCSAFGSNKYAKSIQYNAYLWDLPTGLIKGVIKTESNFKPDAVSSAGAIGLMQVVPHSGGREIWKILYGKNHTPSVALLKSPHANITLGSAYLANLYHKVFKRISNNDIRIMAALAGYNWGPHRVNKMLGKYGTPGSIRGMLKMLHTHAPDETYNYVVKVLERSIQYSRFEQKRIAQNYR